MEYIITAWWNIEETMVKDFFYCKSLEIMEKKMDELKTGKPEKNEQATSIMFSPDLLNEVSKK